MLLGYGLGQMRRQVEFITDLFASSGTGGERCFPALRKVMPRFCAVALKCGRAGSLPGLFSR